MSTTTSAGTQRLKTAVKLRAIRIFTRVPMVSLTVVLILIAFKYLTDPIRSAAAAGITFTTPGGITVARVGFAGFPLAFAAFFLTCVFSERRLLAGLRTGLMLLAIVIAVRLLGMFLAHSSETAKLLVPEMVMAGLCILAMRVEMHRQQAKPFQSHLHRQAS